MDGGSDFAKTEYSMKSDTVNVVLPIGLIESYNFTYLNFRNIGGVKHYHARMNPATNLG